ncbi:hypothetical protein [Nocardia sp. NPDC057455]|uniref:hypothetical protein n=1 Tax=Nocardia sp. NPDC057455 TaxID=3346138 RepID=UPI00366FC5F9
MSAATEAFDEHVDQHGCGDADRPNFNGGIVYCDEAMRLFRAIPFDDPDFPVVFA